MQTRTGANEKLHQFFNDRVKRGTNLQLHQTFLGCLMSHVLVLLVLLVGHIAQQGPASK